MPVLTVNRKAAFDYEILETFEAGIELLGFEVKSVRAGRMSLIGAFAIIRKNEGFLINAVIPPYQATNTPPNYDPSRSRRLLLHAGEIKKLVGLTAERHLTLLPLRVYTKGPRIKVELGLARRKKKYDKRGLIREREDQRSIARAMRHGEGGDRPR
ncbi:MAG: SsrA-binding protein SmpB [Patescibacteria group bacterium]